MSDVLLPKEIWFDILLRLPIKTLVICICTCKTFNDYITSPDFIAAHLQKSKQNPLIFLRYHSRKSKEEHKGTQLYGLHPDDESLLNWDFNMRELPLKTHAPYLRILGCINGVICFSDDLEGYLNVTYLWNPSIKKHIQLPYPTISITKYGPYDMFLGFGLDEVANDFRVVRVVYLDNWDDNYTQLPLVEVFSLKSGSWRYIENTGPNAPKRFHFQFAHSQCFLNGVIHWLGRAQYSMKNLTDIVTFNVVDESFGMIKLPASMDSSPIGYNYTVTTCRDKLALIYLHLEPYVSDSQAYENSRIWVMNEYGVVDSWTPMFILNDPAMVPLFKTITFRKNEDMIMVVNKGTVRESPHVILSVEDMMMRLFNNATVREPCHVIQSVNEKTGVVKELGKHSGYLNGFYLDLYEESLALFNESKQTFEDDGSEDNDVAANDAENSDVINDDVEDNNIKWKSCKVTLFRNK